MNHPTPPNVCSRSGFGSSADIIDALVRPLRPLGLTEPRFFKNLREARHFLIWLDLCGISLQAIGDAVLCAFRRHDCHCPGMEGERLKMSGSNKRAFLTGALKLVQFLEDQSCIRLLDELDANLCHLKYFLARCKKDGFISSSLDKYESSCRHVLIPVASSAHLDYGLAQFSNRRDSPYYRYNLSLICPCLYRKFIIYPRFKN